MASKLFQSKIEETGLKFELLCGVPYGAIPLVTALSIDLDRPMIFKRKDVKDHGTKCLIEGVYQRDQSCLVVDDVISSGISIVETIESLRKSGVIVADTLVILDREQGGAENLKRIYGINQYHYFLNNFLNLIIICQVNGPIILLSVRSDSICLRGLIIVKNLC